MTEKQLSNQIYKWFCLQFPKYKGLFKVNMDGELKLPVHVRKMLKESGCITKGFPDITIFKPYNDKYETLYNGLAIELKKDRSAFLKKDGTLKKNEHLQYQEQFLKDFRYEARWLTVIATDFESVKTLIDLYMKGFFDLKQNELFRKHINENPNIYEVF